MATRHQDVNTSVDILTAREFVSGLQAQQAQGRKDAVKIAAAGVLSAVLFRYVGSRR